METVEECVNLLLDTGVQLEVCLPLHVVLLVVSSEGGVSASWDQVDDLLSSEVLDVNTESLVQRFDLFCSSLCLKTPFKTIVEMMVKVLEVCEAESLPDHHFVHAAHEVAFD